MLLEKGENINFSADDIEFTLIGLSKLNLENKKIMSYIYPIRLDSYLLLENNTNKYNVIRIKTNSINKYSATPNSSILPPKSRIIVKFSYYLQDIDENMNNQLFKIESLLLKDYIPNDYLKFLNIDQSIIELVFEKYFHEIDKSMYNNEKQIEGEVFNLLSSNFSNNSYFCFEKKSILEITYSEDDSSNRNIETVLKKKAFKEDSKKMLKELKITEHEEKDKDKEKGDQEEFKNIAILSNKSNKNHGISNKDLKSFNTLNNNDSVTTESVNLDENLKGVNNEDIKILKKEINLLKEKLSFTRSECARLENVEKTMKDNIFNNLSKLYSCKCIFISDKKNSLFLQMSEYKSETEILYQVSINVLKFFIIFFLLGYILTI